MAAEWLLSLLDCSSHESSVQKSVSDTTKYTLHSFNFVSGTSALHQCQSLEIEPMTDVPQDSASRFLSACQQLEMFAGPIVDLRQSVTAYLGNYLPLVAFVVARERERERERERQQLSATLACNFGPQGPWTFVPTRSRRPAT